MHPPQWTTNLYSLKSSGNSVPETKVYSDLVKEIQSGSVKVLQIADKVVLTEIMGSREINTFGIKTQDLADEIEGSVWFPEFSQVADYLKQNIKKGDLVITLGCGDVYKIAKMILDIEWETIPNI